MYGNAFCLSKTSGNPDRAAMVYELICTDATLTNLWCFGIEGTNYTLDSNGQVVTNSPNNYQVQPQDYLEGNELLRTPMQGEPANLAQVLTDFNSSAIMMKNDGFAFLQNTADVASDQATYGFDSVTLNTLITNLQNQYDVSLTCGMLTDDQINGITQQLVNAGYNGLIQNYNDWYQQWQTDPDTYVTNHS
jgi:putative aldouronate transport system substrate-binding protein